MKQFKTGMAVFGIVLCVAVCAVYVLPTHAEEYSFKVHNSTHTAIKQILVSQDGKTWGKFDIGKGIDAGAAETLVWDQSTNSEACDQYVKAVFADGSEAAPTKFNFCEKGLEIEF